MLIQGIECPVRWEKKIRDHGATAKAKDASRKRMVNGDQILMSY